MAATFSKPHGKSRKSPHRGLRVHKPHGVLHPRVRRVGPEHFGIVPVDCAKHRSKWMLCDFYGKSLVPPTELSHTSGDFAAAIEHLRQACIEHRIADLVIAIERTGNYHLPVKRAFTTAGFECRMVHPFAVKQFRQPANPGNKTDDTDLAANFRATICGFALIEPVFSPVYRRLQLVSRHRRDLVQKRSALCCQIREHLDATLPGFAHCFHDLWDNAVALTLARHFDSPMAIRRAGVAGLAQVLQDAEQRFQTKTLQRLLAWTSTAPLPDTEAAWQHRILRELDDDRMAKTRQIQALEREQVALLVQTPHLLLISLPGIHVVSAAELGGEMGPITNYANAQAITGRSGLFPARYQSDQLDLQNGAIIRCSNRNLRAALLWIADNLRKCNAYFRARADLWERSGKDPKRTRVRIASRFSRIAFHMLAGCQVFQHPSGCGRDYVLDKLLAFHRDHDMTPQETLLNLQAAVHQLPRSVYTEEALPLAAELQKTRTARRRGPQPLGEILPLVLAKLGASHVQSAFSGATCPDACGDQGPN